MSSMKPSSGSRNSGNSAAARMTVPGRMYFDHGWVRSAGDCAHPASLVSSPIRPWGLNTMISTR